MRVERLLHCFHHACILGVRLAKALVVRVYVVAQVGANDIEHAETVEIYPVAEK